MTGPCENCGRGWHERDAGHRVLERGPDGHPSRWRCGSCAVAPAVELVFDTPQLVPVEEVRAGDVLRRPSGRQNVVVRVEAHADGRYVVVYADDEELSWERGGMARYTKHVTKGWRPLAAGEGVPIVRRAADQELARRGLAVVS
jgi:hypothetical protein